MAWNRAIKNSNMDTKIDNRSDIILHINSTVDRYCKSFVVLAYIIVKIYYYHKLTCKKNI